MGLLDEILEAVDGAQKGLSDVVSSCVSTGKNLPISPE